MKYYVFNDTDSYGNAEYDITGEEYLNLMRKCCECTKSFSLYHKDFNTRIYKELEPYKIKSEIINKNDYQGNNYIEEIAYMIPINTDIVLEIHCPKVDEETQTKIIEKEVFGSTELGLYLKDNFYEEIELVGLVSNICVISNAVIARTFSKESKIIVDASATSCFDEELNKKALDVMEGLQIDVINR